MFKKISIVSVLALPLLTCACNCGPDLYQYDLSCNGSMENQNFSIKDSKSQYANFYSNSDYIELDVYDRQNGRLLKEIHILGTYSCSVQKTYIGPLKTEEEK